MYDEKKILSIIADIEKFKEEITGFDIENLEDLDSPLKLRAASMNIFGILNRLADLGAEILAEEKVGAPSRYEDIMAFLAKASVINKETADKLNSLLKKRNYFAHFYHEINEKEIWNTLQDLKIIEPFLATIKKRIKTQKNQ